MKPNNEQEYLRLKTIYCQLTENYSNSTLPNVTMNNHINIIYHGQWNIISD